jgi:hypothetical protein
MNAQTEMTDGLLNACRLAGVDYETALKIKAYMPVSSHLTKPDAGGGYNDGIREAIDAIEQIDDGEAPEYRVCQQAIAELFKPAPPSDVPAEPSVVPMPEPNHVVEKFSIETDEKLADFHYWSEELLTAYTDARVSEATRELVSALELIRSGQVYPATVAQFAQDVLVKYTQTQKESK